MEKIQANLKPETVQRIAALAHKPPTRGIDKMINVCLDEMEKRDCSKEATTEIKGENESE
jgi:hypothetical protein